MKTLFKSAAILAFACLAFYSCASSARSAAASPEKVAVVAHRGFWNCPEAGYAQNSVAALKAAQDAGFWGSEFDVQLTSDGVVGRTTWNKLYEVYNDIANKLLSSSLRPGEYPGVLRTGSSGTAVRELQFYLYLMSAYESSIPPVSIDGKFGPESLKALRTMQAAGKAPEDGEGGGSSDDGGKDEPTYTVTIKGVDAATTTFLLENYDNATAEQEQS